MPTPLSKIPVVGPAAEAATDLAAGAVKLPAVVAGKAAGQVRAGVSLGRTAVEGTARSLLGRVTGRGGSEADAPAPAAPAPAAAPTPKPAPKPAPPVRDEPLTDIDAAAEDVVVKATPADVAAVTGGDTATRSPAEKAPAKKAPAKKAQPRRRRRPRRHRPRRRRPPRPPTRCR